MHVSRSQKQLPRYKSKITCEGNFFELNTVLGITKNHIVYFPREMANSPMILDDTVITNFSNDPKNNIINEDDEEVPIFGSTTPTSG